MKKTKKKPDQVLVGTYMLGSIAVDLFAVFKPGGGSFYTCPEAPSKRQPPRIKVSVADEDWRECLSILMHEALEFAYAIDNLRFVSCGDRANDAANYVFAFTHAQFSQACACATSFLTPAIPALAAVWARQHKKKKK